MNIRETVDIVRGVPARDADPREHLEERLEFVAEFDDASTSDLLGRLWATVGELEDDPRVLECVVLLGAAKPRLTGDLGEPVAELARRGAAAYEERGERHSAIALLQFAVDHLDTKPALERDLAKLLRREGEVAGLADRYLERAQERLDRGRYEEAIRLMQEVLLVDPSRTDVARLIRDLRFDLTQSAKTSRRRRRVAAVAGVVLLAAAAVVLRENQVRDTFAGLPSAEEHDLHSLRERLDRLEGFMDDNPVWHGSFEAVTERSRLRAQVDALESQLARMEERDAQDRARRDLIAEAARARGRAAAEDQEFERAIDEFEAALAVASGDWDQRERVQRDVDSLREYLRETGGQR